MSTRNERERNKKQHDKHLSILMELLREEGNKHCADCRAKGPRWASWNLGIFVCITCAGIHRNLGVHISKVKSVNLDAWTPDQIKNMVEWSNSRAAYHYEYHLPKDFKRPQSDSGLEQFIRNKYEKKLYIKKDGLPSPTETKSVTKPKEKKKTIENSVKKPQELQKTLKVDAPKNKVKNGETKLINKEVPSQNPKQDTLLSLTNQPNAPISQEKREPDTTDDLLNFGSSFSTIPKQEQELTSMSNNDPGYAFNLAQTMAAPKANTNIQIQPSTTNQVVGSTLEDDLLKTDSSTGNQSTKDSIMALYQPSPSTQASQQVFGVPGGVYLQQQQLQQPNISYQSNPQLNNAVTQQFGFQQQQQQQIHQLNQVQQQMAKLGFRQPSPMATTSLHNGQVVPPNRAGPTSQVMPGPQGYNYTQAPPVYGSAGYAPYGNQGPGAGWISGGSVPQQQPTMAPYLTTGPPVPAYNMYPNQGVPTSGQTLSTNLWK